VIPDFPPRFLGNGRFGLYANPDFPPRFLGNGRFGLSAIPDFPPRFLGNGRFGLEAIPDFPPRFLGNGRFGLSVDTLTLAKQGTVRTADKAAANSSFIMGPPQGSWCSWRIAYAI
jgi:hypothetical protein